MSIRRAGSFFATIAVLCGNAAAQSIAYVDATAPPGGDGTTWATAFLDLQAAILAPVDEIWVAAGTYVPGPDVADTFQIRSGLGIYGGFAGVETARNQRDWETHETVLSGDINADDVYGFPVWYIDWNINTPNSKHVVTANGAGPTARLDGFTIAAGYTTFEGGGGMRIVGGAPTIANCTFRRNLAGFSPGGGLYAWNASPTVTGCRFSENYVHLGQGAGIIVVGAGGATIEGCVFSANRCVGSPSGGEAAGAAISNNADLAVTIDGCDFIGNVAVGFYPSGDTSGTYGGAVYNFGPDLTINGSRFIDNFANAGGALYTWRDVLVTNSVFAHNDAPEYHAQQGGWGGIGGGIAASAFQPATVTVANCTLVQNTAESGGGLRMLGSASADIANSVFWANTDALGDIGVSQIRGAHARYSCIQNFLVGEPGEDPPDPDDFPGCIDDDPLFVNLPGDDLHLSAGSPCIDAADNGAVPAGVTYDFDGNSRFLDDPGAPDNGLGTPPIVDMGADERFPGDLNGDGVVSTADLLALLAAWGPCAGCPEDLDGNGSVSTADLLLLLANWTA